jgi:hypothetical protein
MAPRTDIYIPELFETFEFSVMQRQEISRSADGVTRAKDLGDALWKITASTRPMLSSDALAYEAKLRSLNGAIGTFLAGDPSRCNPRAHKDGLFDDDAVVNDLGIDNKSLKLGGLDPGFKISAGDYLSTAGYALHQAMQDAVADGSGITTLFEVFPHIRPGMFSESPATGVTLKQPQAEFALEPGSLSRRRLSGPWWSVSFSGVQIIS